MKTDDTLIRILEGTSPETGEDFFAALVKDLSHGEIQTLERENLLRVLTFTGWRISGQNGAARLLGIPPSTLTPASNPWD